ncbi:MAG: DUF4337 family protein [Candidatus Cybelea sp.]
MEPGQLALRAPSLRSRDFGRESCDHRPRPSRRLLQRVRGKRDPLHDLPSADRQAKDSEARSETIMRSYETLQLGTTFFEIAIVLVSIATLAEVQYFLPAGVVLSGIGLIFLVTGLLQGR